MKTSTNVIRKREGGADEKSCLENISYSDSCNFFFQQTIQDFLSSLQQIYRYKNFICISRIFFVCILFFHNKSLNLVFPLVLPPATPFISLSTYNNKMTATTQTTDHAAHIENISNLFVSYYYTKLHETPVELARLYSKTARLTHTVIPEGVEQLRIKKQLASFAKCNTPEDIKNFYETSNVAHSKICINSIDHQRITGNSVLITTTGLIAITENTPVYSFTQTFVLAPDQSEKNYLIANDIFRLIPGDEFEADSEHVKEDEMTADEKKEEIPVSEPEVVVAVDNASAGSEQETKKEETPKVEEPVAVKEEFKSEAEVKPELKPEEVETLSKTEATPDPKLETIKAEPKSSEKQKTEKQEPKQRSKNESKPKTEKEEHKTKAKESKTESKPEQAKESSPKQEAKAQSKKEDESANTEEAASAELSKENEKPETPQSITWASLASGSTPSEKPTATLQSPKPKPTKPATIESKEKSASPSLKPAKTSKQAKPLNNVTNSQKPTSSSERSHRATPSLAHSAVLHNVNDLKSNEIKELVEREIGATVKVEPRGRFCVIAFETEASQKKALSIVKISAANGTTLQFAKITSETDFKSKKDSSGFSGNKPKQQQQQQQTGSGQRKKTASGSNKK